jgi:peptidoglycan/LPS O-acetylase OafA/YrhL
VDLFFVLSGFLITRILLAAKGTSDYFTSFYTRRILRIFPLYYGMLLLLFVRPFDRIAEALPPKADHLWYWLYLSHWSALLHVSNPDAMGHLWSLAVEEQFYLVCGADFRSRPGRLKAVPAEDCG